MDVSQGDSVAHQELATSGYQAFLYIGKHGEDGGLVQLGYSLCLLDWVSLKVCLDSNTDNIFNGVNNFINLCTFQIVFTLQTKFGC